MGVRGSAVGASHTRVGVCLTLLVEVGRVFLVGAGVRGDDRAPVVGAVRFLSVGGLRASV